jgi:hypothetical protein
MADGVSCLFWDVRRQRMKATSTQEEAARKVRAASRAWAEAHPWRHTARRSRGEPRPSFGILQRELDRIEEDYANDSEYDEATDDALDAASRLFSEPTEEELALIWSRASASSRPTTTAPTRC